MVRRGVASVVMVAAVLLGCVSCSSDDATPSLPTGLVGAADLPGEWSSFTPGVRSKVDLCGRPRDTSAPSPVDSASVGWAVDPDDGPIMGERIERYANPSDARTVLDEQLPAPCDFESADGSGWHTERLAPPGGADTSRLFLVTSRDRSDSFNYNAAVIDGSVVVLVSLNSRTKDPDLLEQVLAAALDRADAAGLTGSSRT